MTQARAHCYQSLQLSVQVADPWSLLTAISSTIAILANGDNPGRAIELYTMLKQDSLGGACRWFDDGIGVHIAAIMEQLPAALVEIAVLKGKQLDQRKTATQLVQRGRNKPIARRCGL